MHRVGRQERRVRIAHMRFQHHSVLLVRWQRREVHQACTHALLAPLSVAHTLAEKRGASGLCTYALPAPLSVAHTLAEKRGASSLRTCAPGTTQCCSYVGREERCVRIVHKCAPSTTQCCSYVGREERCVRIAHMRSRHHSVSVAPYNTRKWHTHTNALRVELRSTCAQARKRAHTRAHTRVREYAKWPPDRAAGVLIVKTSVASAYRVNTRRPSRPICLPTGALVLVTHGGVCPGWTHTQSITCKVSP